MSKTEEMAASERTAADADGYLFRRSLMLQTELQEVLALAGSLDGVRCLEVGASNAMFSFQLHAAGGQWETLAVDTAAADRLTEALEHPVGVMTDDSAWPDADGSFDLIVLPGVLETRDVDIAFVERCHRLLIPGGRMVLTLAREKRLTILKPLLQSRMSPDGVPRRLYSERRLYALLKCGFDVMQVKTFSRFFMTVCDWIVQQMLQKHAPDEIAARCRIADRAYWLYWVAFQLDYLLFLTRGHRMVAVAVRHTWKSREAPVLMDGRSIGEAVLQPITR